MRTFCSKFKNSIILLFEAILYLGCYAVFFALLGIDNKQLLVLSRTSVVITFTWIIVTALLTIIYGGYDVGVRKSRPIAISLTLTALMTDVVAYLLLNIMNRNEDNNQTFKIEFIGTFLIILVIHVVIILVMTYLGNGFYFWAVEPMNTLLVTAIEDEEKRQQAVKRLNKIIGAFHRQYRIIGSVYINDADFEQQFNSSRAVFLYDIPVEKREELVNRCYQLRKSVYFNPQIADILTYTSRQATFDDRIFFAWEEKSISIEQRILKRLMDITIALIALIISSPVFLVSAILIKKCDKGPVFFRQERATVNGRVFSIYKFRTMRIDAGNKSVTKDDDRITPIGHVLRKYRLDELPQFINILKGDMSVVGPRPEMMENVRAYTEELPEFKYRLRMKAGLTGYAQIIGKYNTTSRDKLILDLLYIENYSIFKDIQLIFQTVFVLLKADDSTEAFEE